MAADHVFAGAGWRAVRLSDIDLSVRTSNCLRHMGLTTLGELVGVSEAELLAQPNFGNKSLAEVKELVKEHIEEENRLDFAAIGEPLLSNVLRTVQTLNLTVRASNAMENLRITVVGELVQLTESELRRMPNVGRGTINNLKRGLSDLGLSLETSVQNWPGKEELVTLLEERARQGRDRIAPTAGGSAFLEDELRAVLKVAVNSSECAIVMRRTGWDGGKVWTLDELANNPAASGLTSKVTRERIRQIESKAIGKIRKKRMSTPVLHRTIALIRENLPLAISDIPHLLLRHGITQRALDYRALSAAIEVFDVDWDVVCTRVGGEALLLPEDQEDRIVRCWGLLVAKATRQDFVELDQVVSADRNSTCPSLDLAARGVSVHPSLGWIDCDRHIYWSIDRVKTGWNKSINVCRKLLTVAPEVPLQRLAQGVKRARTVKKFPPDDVFERMLLGLEEFEVRDGIVSRGERFKLEKLSKTDWVMIRAAMDAGTVTTFSELRKVLVQRGLSTNSAQVLMVVSPFWNTYRRGKYRFVCNESQLREFWLERPVAMGGSEEHEECLVELEVNHRHLVAGNHRIEENKVRPGRWSLRDEQGNELGEIDVTGTMIKGLGGSFSAAGVEAGAFVIIDFSENEFVAALYR